MRTVWKKAIACVASCLLALLYHVASGQTPSQNYVRESILLDKFTSDPCTDYDLARNTVTYYDGLGRLVQTVKVGAGWNVFDIHTITEYDSYGKPCKAWLRGDDNAKAIFEFLSEHITGSETMVEMGWAKTGIEGDKGLNFISTGHKKKS